MICTDVKSSASSLKAPFLQQPFSHCETSQCCLWQPELRNIGADLKRSVSNMKPTCSATTGFLWWKVPCCPWRPKHEITGTALKTSASNMKPTFSATTIVLTVKRLSVVHDSKNLGTSVLIWRGLLRIRNQQYLQQPFSCGERSRCRPRQPKPRIIGDDLKRSA